MDATEPMLRAREGDRVVVIDDDYAMRLSCRQILAKVGYEVETFGEGAPGLAGVARLKPGLVVVDLKMPGLSGIEVIRRIHATDPTIVIVVITGYATIDTAIEAMQAGAYDFLPKPFSPDQLRLLVTRGLEKRRLQLDSHRLEMEREILKRRFVSFVSHQLKSPLAVVHQYLEVLLRLEGSPDVEGKRRGWIDRCLRRTDEMRELIDHWLTLARVEGASTVERRERVDLSPVLSGVVDACHEAANGASVALALAPIATELPVDGDRSGLGVLFENLIGNAIKYNRPGGRVDVEAHLEAGEVVVAVADTGEGIPPEAQPFLFDEFYRVKSGRTARVGGSGLGLAICRRIVDDHGGSIEVESHPGEGSTFRVRLPAWAPADEVETRSAPATTLSGGPS